MKPRLMMMLALLLAATGTVLAAGGSSVSTTTPSPTPESEAREHYNEALSLRDEAWRLQKKADDADLPEAKREKATKRIAEAFDKARGNLERAVDMDPGFHQAWGSLGYVYRQLGDLDRALAAYDRALELSPRYEEAIEYRAEAYLALGRIEDAKSAYADLAESKPKLAGELIVAMSSWIDHQRRTGGTDVGEIDALERWVAERQDGQQVSSKLRKSRRW